VELECLPGLVPTVLVTLGANEAIYGEHGIMLFKDPPVGVSRKTIQGGGMLQTLERTTVGGIPYFLTEFTGPGHVGLSRDGTGEVRILDLAPGQTVDVAEGSLICADAHIQYGMEYVKGTHRPGRMSGVWLDRLTGPGKIAVHGYGNIISMTLAPRELIHIDMGGMLWKDASVTAKTVNLPFGGGLLGKLEAYEVLELIGPGQIAIQSIDPKSHHF
jgi:uncharacterized protein (AIM24 family)